MPVYEYKCTSCGDVFEVMQKVSDEPLAVHKSCGGRLERLISPPALQFKGSGWYITDYAKGTKEKPSADATSKESPGGGESKQPAKTEAPTGTSSGSEK